jgi:hypothetical protein
MHDQHERSDAEARVERLGENRDSRRRDAVTQRQDETREIERQKLKRREESVGGGIFRAEKLQHAGKRRPDF